MLNSNKLQECSKLLKSLISDNLKSYNSQEMGRLVDIISRLDLLISIQENPEKHNKINKLCDPDKHG